MTLTVSIARPSPQSPLVLSGHDESVPLGVLELTHPGKAARVNFSQPATGVHGAFAYGWSWGQSNLVFQVSTFVDTAAESKAALDELVTAVSQLSFEVTVTDNGVASTWLCNPGDMTPARYEYTDHVHHTPIWTVVLPCYPLEVPA